MTQDQVIVLCLKVGLVSGLASLVGWIAVYTRYARWWRNPVGRTLVAKTAIIAGLFIPQILSLFFRLNRLDSHIAAWTDVTLIGLVTPVMAWRIVVWARLDRLGTLPDGNDDPEEGTPPDGTG